MTPLLCLVLLTSGPATEVVHPGGSEITLLAPESCPGPSMPYDPQPGDILLFATNTIFAKVACSLTMVGGTSHSAIVFRRPEGTIGLLETPHIGSRVEFTDVAHRVRSYKGKVYVRRRITPLTPKQSECLTNFACSQVGKPYDFHNLLKLPIAWPVRIFDGHCLKPADLDRWCWNCTTLVVSACVAAGIMDPCVVKPTSTCPHDLYNDAILDISCGWHKPQLAVATACRCCDHPPTATALPVLTESHSR